MHFLKLFKQIPPPPNYALKIRLKQPRQTRILNRFDTSKDYLFQLVTHMTSASFTQIKFVYFKRQTIKLKMRSINLKTKQTLEISINQLNKFPFQSFSVKE